VEEKAVIDRIVDNRYAVLLVGDEEREVVLPVEQLPEDASEGTWLRVQIANNAITAITVDPDETETVRRRITEKMALLRMRGGRLKRK
jgi:hypothetical protein